MINGKEIHESFRKRLEEGILVGEVHSVFSRVINFKDDRGRLYSVLDASMDHNPDSIILDIEGLDRLGISAGDHTSGSIEGLRIGRFLVELEQAKSYTLSLPDYGTDAVPLRSRLADVRARIGKIESDRPTPFLAMMDSMIEERRQLLQDELSVGNLEAGVRLGRKLLGLGQGLTPSGDDILLGLFCVILMGNSPLEGLKAFPELLLEGADSLTNELSLWGLKRAAKGQVREKVSGFIKDLAEGKEIANSLESILEIGHSSGKDITIGILTGFELIAHRGI